MYNLYSSINSLPEFSFIAGTEYTLEFTVYDEDGISPLDIGASTVKLCVSPYGQPDYMVIEKTGVLSGTQGVFSVTFSKSDTENLRGKFIHQPVITDFSGTEFRLAQGSFTIIPKIS